MSDNVEKRFEPDIHKHTTGNEQPYCHPIRGEQHSCLQLVVLVNSPKFFNGGTKGMRFLQFN